MRSLERLPEPEILTTKKERWTQTLLLSGKKRPDSSKYAHSKVKDQLNSMSFHKCFYCETKLKGRRKEVDHHIEVAENIKLSYEWTNLFLSCDNCNNKIPNKTIPITDALDPCCNSDVEIETHLTFHDELIDSKDNSQIGLKTIKKYRLDNEVLDTRRLKQLKLFHKLLIEILKSKTNESRTQLNDDEKVAIERFKSRNQSFSLMFKILINDII